MRGVVLLVLVVLACGSAVLVGPDLGGDAGRFVVWQLRVPRMLVGVLVGAMLGLVGAAFQALFQNDSRWVPRRERRWEPWWRWFSGWVAASRCCP